MLVCCFLREKNAKTHTRVILFFILEVDNSVETTCISVQALPLTMSQPCPNYWDPIGIINEIAEKRIHVVQGSKKGRAYAANYARGL